MSLMPTASIAYLRIALPVLSTAGDASEAALSVRTHSVTPTLEADPRDILFQKNTQPVSLELLNIRDTVFKIYAEIYTEYIYRVRIFSTIG